MWSSLLVAVALSVGCRAVSPATSTDEVVDSAPQEGYQEVLDALETRRLELSARYAVAAPAERALVVEEARETVERAVVEELFVAWTGTRWAFHGTTEVPGQGTIACGYFVSTVLRDAGFRVERKRLAQQAAEHIILTLVPSRQVQRYRFRTTEEVVDAVDGWGDGLYLVGLDYHVGFLVRRGDLLEMCHSSYLGTGGVVCEDARTSPAMESRYRVVGRLLEDPMMEAWLTGAPIITRTR
jgi:hypothetical protein